MFWINIQKNSSKGVIEDFRNAPTTTASSIDPNRNAKLLGLSYILKGAFVDSSTYEVCITQKTSLKYTAKVLSGRIEKEKSVELTGFPTDFDFIGLLPIFMYKNFTVTKKSSRNFFGGEQVFVNYSKNEINTSAGVILRLEGIQNGEEFQINLDLQNIKCSQARILNQNTRVYELVLFDVSKLQYLDSEYLESIIKRTITEQALLVSRIRVALLSDSDIQ